MAWLIRRGTTYHIRRSLAGNQRTLTTKLSDSTAGKQESRARKPAIAVDGSPVPSGHG